MPHIIFVDSEGREQTIDSPSGISLMEAAVRKDVRGIEADCGGACTCATCHVYIAAPWQAATGQRHAEEEAMLEFAVDVRETSRLSCQVLLTDALDGIVVELPASQG